MQGLHGPQLTAFVLRAGAGRDVEGWNAAQEFLHRHANFEPCQMFANAAMRANAECGVNDLRARHIEAGRVGAHLRVARCGGVVQRHPVAGFEGYAAHFHRFADRAAHRHDRRIKSHRFFDGRVHARRIGAQGGA